MLRRRVASGHPAQRVGPQRVHRDEQDVGRLGRRRRHEGQQHHRERGHTTIQPHADGQPLPYAPGIVGLVLAAAFSLAPAPAPRSGATQPRPDHARHHAGRRARLLRGARRHARPGRPRGARRALHGRADRLAADAAGPRFAPHRASIRPSTASSTTGPPCWKSDVPDAGDGAGRRGYATAAFVASRILDRRFGLGRGFATYDDRMAAEQHGRVRLPRAGAAAVTAPALAWLKARAAREALLPLGPLLRSARALRAPGATPRRALRGRGRRRGPSGRPPAEGAARRPSAPVVAAVGGPRRVAGRARRARPRPLPLRARAAGAAAPGRPRTCRRAASWTGRRRRGAWRPTLAAPARARPARCRARRSPGSGPPTAPRSPSTARRWLPATAYGWSPLRALSDRRGWRYVDAPRPELYDVAADPGEPRTASAASRRRRRGCVATSRPARTR